MMYSESLENGTWISSSAIVDLLGTMLDVVTDCLGRCEREGGSASCELCESGGEGGRMLGLAGRPGARPYDSCRL